MSFATRSDLLARSNARRLAQLAVPADLEMVPDDALRAAITGNDLSAFSQEIQNALTLAIDAIDKALFDADALIVSYGIPESVQSSLLARLASTVALYYLQGAERMTEDVRKAYEGVIATLTSHSMGRLDLIPTEVGESELNDDVAIVESQPSRYGRGSSTASRRLDDCDD